MDQRCAPNVEKNLGKKEGSNCVETNQSKEKPTKRRAH
jgi:hypothetical protein